MASRATGGSTTLHGLSTAKTPPLEHGGALIFCGLLFPGGEAQGAAKDQDTANPGDLGKGGTPTHCFHN